MLCINIYLGKELVSFKSQPLFSIEQVLNQIPEAKFYRAKVSPHCTPN